MSGTIGESQVLTNQPITLYGQVEDLDMAAEKDSEKDSGDFVLGDRAPALDDVKVDAAVAQVPREKTCFELACPLLSISYAPGYCRFYMPYFDVTTKEVLSKIGSALIPYNGSFHEKIKAKADLYVPFWTYITISMLITVVSNTMRYLNDRENYGRFDFSILIASFTFVSHEPK